MEISEFWTGKSETWARTVRIELVEPAGWYAPNHWREYSMKSPAMASIRERVGLS